MVLRHGEYVSRASFARLGEQSADEPFGPRRQRANIPAHNKWAVQHHQAHALKFGSAMIQHWCEHTPLRHAWRRRGAERPHALLVFWLPESVWRHAWQAAAARCLPAVWAHTEIHMVLHDVRTNGMRMHAHHTYYRQRGDSNPCGQSPMDF